MKKLYRIFTRILGKDLDKTFLLGYITAESDNEIFNFIDAKYRDDNWDNYGGSMNRESIIEERGDLEDDYLGEFYDQKYGWEEAGEASEADLGTLQKLKLLLTPESE